MVRAYDGRMAKSDFSVAVFQALGLADIADITRVLYRDNLSRTAIAALAPIVTRWADAGEIQARAIIQRAVAEVVETIQAVFQRLFSDSAVPVALAIVGSLGNSSGYYHDTLAKAVAAACPRLVMQKARLEPVVGAALWAFQTHNGLIDTQKLDLEALSSL